MIKLIAATTLAIALLVGVMPYGVHAETAEQNQEVSVECSTTSGSYGQTSTANCKVLGKQSQKITLRRNVPRVKSLANTGLDTSTALLGSLTIGAGLMAAVIKSKSRE